MCRVSTEILQFLQRDKFHFSDSFKKLVQLDVLAMLTEASHFPGAHWEFRQHARHPRTSQSRRFPGQVHAPLLHSLPPLHTRSAFVPQ